MAQSENAAQANESLVEVNIEFDSITVAVVPDRISLIQNPMLGSDESLERELCALLGINPPSDVVETWELRRIDECLSEAVSKKDYTLAQLLHSYKANLETKQVGNGKSSTD